MVRWAGATQREGGLKALPHAVGRYIGVVVDQWQMQDPSWRAMVLQNFNLITLGKLKWSYSRPRPDVFDFHETDWMVSFCRAQGLAMHGHNLCWNTANPDWLDKTLSSQNAAKLLEEHITVTMKRYAGSISSYDVVNEPMAPWRGRPDGLYPGPWLTALGPAYIDIAFHIAAAVDPTALRVLNIAHVEQGGSGSDATRTMTLNLIESLLRRNVPVQAIGFESHLVGSYPVAATSSRVEFIRELRQLGLKVLITEFDIDDTGIEGTLTERDHAVASCYGNYLGSMLAEAGPERIIFFSPSDLRNWYDAVHTPQYTRPDGQPHRPGLFSSDLQAKPAYYAVAGALGAAATNTEPRP